MSSQRIAIVGYGSFGTVLAERLPHDNPIGVIVQHEIALPSYCIRQTYADLIAYDIVLLAVPLEPLEAVLQEVVKWVKPHAIVADVCSVKLKPAQLLMTYCKDVCRAVATHPLFGPQILSVQALNEQTLVWCRLEDDCVELRAIFQDIMGLQLVEMTPEMHDKEMAWIHALTFFVGRSLLEMDIPPLQLQTGYFAKLCELQELERHHSAALFTTIEQGNPFAADVRRRYVETITRIDAQLGEKQGEIT